jgi:hypothetical protein
MKNFYEKESCTICIHLVCSSSFPDLVHANLELFFLRRGSATVDTPTLLDSASASPREGRDSPVCLDGGSVADGKEQTGRAVLEKCVAEMERQASTQRGNENIDSVPR